MVRKRTLLGGFLAVLLLLVALVAPAAPAAHAADAAAKTIDATLEVQIRGADSGTTAGTPVYADGILVLSKTGKATTVSDGATGSFIPNGSSKRYAAAVKTAKGGTGATVTIAKVPGLGTISFPLASPFPTGTAAPQTYTWTATAKGSMATGTIAVADAASDTAVTLSFSAQFTRGPLAGGALKTIPASPLALKLNAFGAINQGTLTITGAGKKGADLVIPVSGIATSTTSGVITTTTVQLVFRVGKITLVGTGSGTLPNLSGTVVDTSSPDSFGTWTTTAAKSS